MATSPISEPYRIPVFEKALKASKVWVNLDAPFLARIQDLPFMDLPSPTIAPEAHRCTVGSGG